MRIDRSYISNQNTYAENDPRCIVVHNTDNFAAGADALAHARAQHDGNFQNMSAHYYVDDGDVAYQAAPHSRGCWHVGVNYGGNNLFGRYGNRSSIGVEMCVQAGYDYEKAFQNTVALVKEIMRETGIPAARVYRHYDICSKHCPSQIMNNGDWERFKKAISSSSSSSTPKQPEKKMYEPGIYRVNTDLNIREKPDADSRIVGMITDQGSYTVTEIKNTSWGRLLSGAGWINCHTKYCTYGGAAEDVAQKQQISVDGVWGPELTRRLQEIFKTGVDGKISNQPNSNKKYCAGIAAAEWSGKLSGGSDLIKAMQRWAGVTADGYLGPQTIRAMQRKLGTTVDGVISYPSAMVRDLQEWCNRQ
ncbi:MAG: N-acetylmuramoyl-L-alanine amidase [Fusicatenibacter saccharivorans]|nr:N-acetylmuramoyl-L-alanine amidase [Fusicatenibacter saccharivorans]